MRALVSSSNQADCQKKRRSNSDDQGFWHLPIVQCNLELLTHHKMNVEEGKERNYENSLYEMFMKTKITKAWDGSDIT